MYVKMVLRNKRFKPTFPVRESNSFEEPDCDEKASELVVVPVLKHKADDPELDVLAV